MSIQMQFQNAGLMTETTYLNNNQFIMSTDGVWWLKTRGDEWDTIECVTANNEIKDAVVDNSDIYIRPFLKIKKSNNKLKVNTKIQINNKPYTVLTEDYVIADFLVGPTRFNNDYYNGNTYDNSTARRFCLSWFKSNIGSNPIEIIITNESTVIENYIYGTKFILSDDIEDLESAKQYVDKLDTYSVLQKDTKLSTELKQSIKGANLNIYKNCGYINFIINHELSKDELSQFQIWFDSYIDDIFKPELEEQEFMTYIWNWEGKYSAYEYDEYEASMEGQYAYEAFLDEVHELEERDGSRISVKIQKINDISFYEMQYE